MSSKMVKTEVELVTHSLSCWSFCTSVDSCPSDLPYSGNCAKGSENKRMTTSIHVAIVIAAFPVIKPTRSILIPSFRLPRWLQQPPIIINPPFITPSDLGDQCWGPSGNPGTCETGDLCVWKGPETPTTDLDLNRGGK